MITVPVPTEFILNSVVIFFVLKLYRSFKFAPFSEKIFRDLICTLFLGGISLLFEDFLYLLLPVFFMILEFFRHRNWKFSKMNTNYFLLATILELTMTFTDQNICKFVWYIIKTLNISRIINSYVNLYLVLGTLLNFLMFCFIRGLFSKFEFRIQELQKKILLYGLDNQILLMLASLFFSFEAIVFIGDIEGITELMSVTIMIMFIAFTGLMTWMVFNLIQVWSLKQKVANSVEQNQQFDEYLKSVQQQYADLRKFKHDFKNIVLSMKVGSDSDFSRNYEELYQELIDKKEMITDLDGRILSEYKKIANGPLRGLVIQKFFKAKSNNLKLNVQISGDAINIDDDILDVIRVVGILLDNAIEETIKSKDKNISMAFIKNNNTLEISVENPLAHAIDIRKIFRDGYSTKGSGRGTGLANVSRIVDGKSNLYLDTEIINDRFRITLMILERDK